MRAVAPKIGIYFATPNKFNKIHPVIIRTSETIPMELSLSPNNTAEIIADTTIPIALQVVYTPFLLLYKFVK